jgi:hypothetical protein
MVHFIQINETMSTTKNKLTRCRVQTRGVLYIRAALPPSWLSYSLAYDSPSCTIAVQTKAKLAHPTGASRPAPL